MIAENLIGTTHLRGWQLLFAREDAYALQVLIFSTAAQPSELAKLARATVQASQAGWAGRGGKASTPEIRVWASQPRQASRAQLLNQA